MTKPDMSTVFIFENKIAMRPLLIVFAFCQATLSFAQINCDTIIPPPSESKYVLPYPVGKTYKIIQGSCPTTPGGHANTFAYDFDTQMGDTIVACRDGLVIWTNEQYGNTDYTSGHENNVFIRHNDGTVIRYTHLQQNGALVNANMYVMQGQPIGLSGKSGNTGGVPHLHLQLFQDATSYDKENSLPLNFSNTNDPVNAQNLLINGQSYTALNGTPTLTVDATDLLPNMSVSPNPFSNTAQIEIMTKKAGYARLDVFDSKGKLIKNIYSGKIDAGRQLFLLEISPAMPGIYFLHFVMDGNVFSEKVILF